MARFYSSFITEFLFFKTLFRLLKVYDVCFSSFSVTFLSPFSLSPLFSLSFRHQQHPAEDHPHVTKGHVNYSHPLGAYNSIPQAGFSWPQWALRVTFTYLSLQLMVRGELALCRTSGFFPYPILLAGIPAMHL